MAVTSFGPTLAFDYLTQHGYSPVQAAAIAGNIQQESNFDPTNLNKREGAYGLLQWRGSRLQGLKDYASSVGADASDPYVQLDYIGKEMAGPEAKNASGFQDATDLQSANAALKPYIRYGDNSQGARLKYASNILGGPPISGPQPPTASLPPQNQQPQSLEPQKPLPPQPLNLAQQQTPQLPSFGGGQSMLPQQQPMPQAPVLNAPQMAQLAPLMQRINMLRAFQNIPLPAGFKGFSYS